MIGEKYDWRAAMKVKWGGGGVGSGTGTGAGVNEYFWEQI